MTTRTAPRPGSSARAATPGPRHRAPRDGGPFTGTLALFRAQLRLQARGIAPWVVLVAALSVTSVVGYEVVFEDPDDRRRLATSLAANPAMALIFGPVRDLTTADGFNSWRAGNLGAFFTALMVLLLVVRTSRADEDTGQAELLASGVVGRQARLAASVLLAWLASLVLGLLTFAATVAVGGGVVASALLAGSFATAGLLFSAVAAVAAQLGSDARAASGLAVATLGVAFGVRGAVDATDLPGWADWVSPLGWLQQTLPATEQRVWPLALVVGLAACLVLVGFVLHARRDYGEGILPPRPGPARGGMETTVWGLSLRLHAGALLAWLIGFVALGGVFGYLVRTAVDVIRGNPTMAQVLAAGAVSETDLSGAVVATVLQLVGIVASVLGVQVVMRLYVEESEDRVEPLLAGAVRRRTYLGSVVVVALLAPAAALLVAGALVAAVAGGQADTPSRSEVLGQAAATVPAVWVLVGLAVAAVGARPVVRVVAWLGVVGTFAITLLGPLFELPERVLAVSPLWHVPEVATAGWAGAGADLGRLLGVAALLVLVGFLGFRRRDIAT